MTPEEREKTERMIKLMCGGSIPDGAAILYSEIDRLEAENATLEMQFELAKETYNLDRQRLKEQLEIETKRREVNDGIILDLTSRAVPDWGEPGVVPSVSGEYGFQFHDPGAVWRCVSSEVDEDILRWDGQIFSLARLPEIFNWFRFFGPIPLPREKE